MGSNDENKENLSVGEDDTRTRSPRHVVLEDTKQEEPKPKEKPKKKKPTPYANTKVREYKANTDIPKHREAPPARDYKSNYQYQRQESYKLTQNNFYMFQRSNGRDPKKDDKKPVDEDKKDNEEKPKDDKDEKPVVAAAVVASENKDETDKDKLPPIQDKAHKRSASMGSIKPERTDSTLPPIVAGAALVSRPRSADPPRKRDNGLYKAKEYKGYRQYNSDYQYKHKDYDVKPEYLLTDANCYGFTHSIDKNRKSKPPKKKKVPTATLR